MQLPLPKQINETKVLYAIDPKKDVDGFHPVNVGKMMIGEADYLPCTPAGIQQLLIRSGVKTDGAEVVVVGRSNIVGKPIANILLQKQAGANATVTICHTGTKEMASHTRRADILIVAAGRPKAITADMVREGAVVIDVGVNRIGMTAEGKAILCGDVDFDSVKEKASMITPVPGGVGPMTITMLMANTLKAAKMAAAGRIERIAGRPPGPASRRSFSVSGTVITWRIVSRNPCWIPRSFRSPGNWCREGGRGRRRRRTLWRPRPGRRRGGGSMRSPSPTTPAGTRRFSPITWGRRSCGSASNRWSISPARTRTATRSKASSMRWTGQGCATSWS